MEALPRRDRERLLRRQAMLDAARAVFAEKGYEQATVDEVAERAEFGKGTLYNYFEGGKEGILHALIEDLFDRVEGIVAEHVGREGGEPVQEVFRGLLASLMGFFEANRDTFVLVITEVQRLMLAEGNAVEARVWARDERIVSLLQGPIERAIAAGNLRPFPPKAVARTLLGNMHGMLMHLFCAPPSVQEDPRFSADEAAAFITTLIFDGLRPRS